jgi:ADP-heptose:LPS heptosyltransferase
MYILIVRNDRLGDLILSLPTVLALKDQYPDARLGAVTAASTAPVLDLLPFRMDSWPDTSDSLDRLAADPPEVMLFLYPDRRWAWKAFRARVPRRIGTRYRPHSILFNERMPVHRRHNQRHEAECNLQVAQSLIGEIRMTPPTLRIPGSGLASAHNLRQALGLSLSSPYIMIHPGSKGSAWNWPVESYSEVARNVASQGIEVLVTGTDTEAALARQVAGDWGHSIAGQTDLTTLAALLSEANTLIVGSTGPMHLAAACGLSVVALFSPLRTHAPSRWGPLGVDHTVLMAQAGSKGKSVDPAVMRSITPKNVFDATMRYVGRSTGTA